MNDRKDGFVSAGGAKSHRGRTKERRNDETRRTSSLFENSFEESVEPFWALCWDERKRGNRLESMRGVEEKGRGTRDELGVGLFFDDGKKRGMRFIEERLEERAKDRSPCDY